MLSTLKAVLVFLLRPFLLKPPLKQWQLVLASSSCSLSVVYPNSLEQLLFGLVPPASLTVKEAD